MPQPKILLMSASPNPVGTTAHVAALLAQHFEKTAGHGVRPLSLAGLHFLGCTHCGGCEQPPHACLLGLKDDCERIFEALLEANIVVWLSPVYFYGLPAQAKALVDRSQRLFEKTRHDFPDWPARLPTMRGRGTSILLSGRTRGKRLFVGSHLALTHFFASLGLSHEASFCLPGVENRMSLPATLAGDLAALAEWLPVGGSLPKSDALTALETLDSAGERSV